MSNILAARKLYTISSEDSTYRVAVFNREVVEDLLEEFSLGDGCFDQAALASVLTGWAAFSRGPGRAFGCDPSVRVGRRNVVVKQLVALDV